MAKKVNGEAAVEVTRIVRNFGEKTETTLKKEDVLMASDGENGIKEDAETPTEDQKALPDNPATVSVGKKLTLNIGNYQSVTVSVHLSMPCPPDKDHVNEMYDKVNKWVDARIGQERESVRKAQSQQNM